MRKRSSKNPRDINQLAAHIVAVTTDQSEEAVVSLDAIMDKPAESTCSGKNPAAVALGRLGGKKGGKARAEKLTPEQRSESARKAAQARWKKPSS